MRCVQSWKVCCRGMRNDGKLPVVGHTQPFIPMRNQESEIGFLGATAGLPSSALYHLFERALVSVIWGSCRKMSLRA